MNDPCLLLQMIHGLIQFIRILFHRLLLWIPQSLDANVEAPLSVQKTDLITATTASAAAVPDAPDRMQPVVHASPYALLPTSTSTSASVGTRTLATTSSS